MTPYYLAIPASRKPEIPPSLLPALRTGHCSGCGLEVVFHGGTFNRWLRATEIAGWKWRIVCDKCAAKEVEDSPTPYVEIQTYTPEVGRHFCKG